MNKKKTSKSNKPQSYVNTCLARLTDAMREQIKAMALERHATESEIIRDALASYINRQMSDAEIVHAQMSELTRRVRYLDDKLELLGLLAMRQSRLLFETLPSGNGISVTAVNAAMEKFKHGCIEELQSKGKGGVLEAMVLAAYERSEED